LSKREARRAQRYRQRQKKEASDRVCLTEWNALKGGWIAKTSDGDEMLLDELSNGAAALGQVVPRKGSGFKVSPHLEPASKSTFIPQDSVALAPFLSAIFRQTAPNQQEQAVLLHRDNSIRVVAPTTQYTLNFLELQYSGIEIFSTVPANVSYIKVDGTLYTPQQSNFYPKYTVAQRSIAIAASDTFLTYRETYSHGSSIQNRLTPLIAAQNSNGDYQSQPPDVIYREHDPFNSSAPTSSDLESFGSSGWTRYNYTWELSSSLQTITGSGFKYMVKLTARVAATDQAATLDGTTGIFTPYVLPTNYKIQGKIGLQRRCVSTPLTSTSAHHSPSYVSSSEQKDFFYLVFNHLAVPGTHTHALDRTNSNKNPDLYSPGQAPDNTPNPATLTPGALISSINDSTGQAAPISAAKPDYVRNFLSLATAEMRGQVADGFTRPLILFYPNLLPDYSVFDDSVSPAIYRPVDLTSNEQALDWRYPTQYPSSITGTCEIAIAGDKGQSTGSNLLNGIEGGALVSSLELRLGAASNGAVEVSRRRRTDNGSGCDQGSITRKDLDVPPIPENNAIATEWIASSVAWTRTKPQ